MVKVDNELRENERKSRGLTIGEELEEIRRKQREIENKVDRMAMILRRQLKR